MITLTLPYPISANRYWASRAYIDKATRKPMAVTYVTAEAKDFKEQVGWIAKSAGVRAPFAGRVHLTVELYPHRPLDYRTRMRKLGPNWDDGVQCIDIDNALKVLIDSLRGIVINDDSWQNRKTTIERMEPDDKGARVVLRIEQIARPVVQGDLLGAAA